MIYIFHYFPQVFKVNNQWCYNLVNNQWYYKNLTSLVVAKIEQIEVKDFI